MDTLSHGLWVTVLARGVNLKSQNKIKVRWMVLWGVLPDLFAFSPAVAWMLWQMFYKGVEFSHIPRPEIMPPEVRNTFLIFRFTETLYHMSHSFVIFFALFFLVWAIRWYKFTYPQKSVATVLEHSHQQSTRPTPYWEITGWFIHILIDIPSHSEVFYPTLFLWPLSDVRFDGVSWGNKQFMITNYSCLLMVFILLSVFRRVKFRRGLK